MHMFKVSNRITRKKYEVCSKLTKKTPEWHHVDFEQLFVHVDIEQLFVCLNLAYYAVYEVAFLAYKRKQFYVHKNSTVRKSKIYLFKMNWH